MFLRWNVCQVCGIVAPFLGARSTVMPVEGSFLSVLSHSVLLPKMDKKGVRLQCDRASTASHNTVWFSCVPFREHSSCIILHVPHTLHTPSGHSYQTRWVHHNTERECQGRCGASGKAFVLSAWSLPTDRGTTRHSGSIRGIVGNVLPSIRRNIRVFYSC